MLRSSISELHRASELLPGLDRGFDFANSDELSAKHLRLNTDSFATWSYTASTGERICHGHDDRYLSLSIVRDADSLFTRPGYGFQDQLVMDLGAGSSAIGYQVARDLGARGYIGVEFCFAPKLAGAIEALPQEEKTIPRSIVYDSIENVLNALPRQSVSFIISGIDDTFPNFKKLQSALAATLPSALHTRGACLLYSPIHEHFSFPGLINSSQLQAIPVWIHPNER